MLRTFLRSKIHRATVTEADLNYEGSITIDAVLLEAADIAPFEMVDIYNITNGNRLTTYAIVGEPGSGEICINGAAARLVRPKDCVIVCCYGQFEPAEMADHQVRIVHVDQHNAIRDVVVVDAVSRRVPPDQTLQASLES
jgi:aspartate 1-decarboxylase